MEQSQDIMQSANPFAYMDQQPAEVAPVVESGTANTLFGGSDPKPDHSINQQDGSVHEAEEDEGDGNVFDYFNQSTPTQNQAEEHE